MRSQPIEPLLGGRFVFGNGVGLAVGLSVVAGVDVTGACVTCPAASPSSPMFDPLAGAAVGRGVRMTCGRSVGLAVGFWIGTAPGSVGAGAEVGRCDGTGRRVGGSELLSLGSVVGVGAGDGRKRVGVGRCVGVGRRVGATVALSTGSVGLDVVVGSGRAVTGGAGSTASSPVSGSSVTYGLVEGAVVSDDDGSGDAGLLLGAGVAGGALVATGTCFAGVSVGLDVVGSDVGACVLGRVGADVEVGTGATDVCGAGVTVALGSLVAGASVRSRLTGLVVRRHARRGAEVFVLEPVAAALGVGGLAAVIVDGSEGSGVAAMLCVAFASTACIESTSAPRSASATQVARVRALSRLLRVIAIETARCCTSCRHPRRDRARQSHALTCSHESTRAAAVAAIAE